MRTSTVLPAAALLAALAAAAPAGAGSSFTGNVCGLVTAKQVATIPGVSSRCTNARPSKGPGSTLYVGNWAGETPRSPHLQVTVALYTDAGVLQLAKHNLKQGLPGGTPRKEAGIGEAAYEASGAGALGLHVSVGKYIVYATLTALGTAPPSSTSFEALARSIAGRL
jgi:hypothetical protein